MLTNVTSVKSQDAIDMQICKTASSVLPELPAVLFIAAVLQSGQTSKNRSKRCTLTPFLSDTTQAVLLNAALALDACHRRLPADVSLNLSLT